VMVHRERTMNAIVYCTKQSLNGSGTQKGYGPLRWLDKRREEKICRHQVSEKCATRVQGGNKRQLLQSGEHFACGELQHHKHGHPASLSYARRGDIPAGLLRPRIPSQHHTHRSSPTPANGSAAGMALRCGWVLIPLHVSVYTRSRIVFARAKRVNAKATRGYSTVMQPVSRLVHTRRRELPQCTIWMDPGMRASMRLRRLGIFLVARKRSLSGMEEKL
jgi:hypothetical protein